MFSGMNGTQLAVLTYLMPKPITARTIATFTYTMKLLNFADSLMPTTRSTVSTSTISIAGTLRMPLSTVPPAAAQLATEIAVCEIGSTAKPPVAGSTQSCERTSVCVPSTVNGEPAMAAGMWIPSEAKNAVK